jgi:hypothetical protein
VPVSAFRPVPRCSRCVAQRPSRFRATRVAKARRKGAFSAACIRSAAIGDQSAFLDFERDVRPNPLVEVAAESRLSLAAGLGAPLSSAEQRRRAEADLQSGGTAFDAEVAGTQRLAVQIDIELAVALEFDP